MTDQTQSAPLKPWMGTMMGVAAIAFATGVYVVYEPSKAAEATITLEESALPPVSVTSVTPDAYNALITTQAVVSPRHDVLIRSFVEGAAYKVSEDLLPGNRVSAGDSLIRIDDHPIRAELENARNRFANAELQLAMVENEAKLARQAWALAEEDTAPPPLANHELQVKAAQAELNSAKAEISYAKNRLGYTHIRAPFSGVIVERGVAQGMLVSPGEDMFRIQSDQVVDLDVNLSIQDLSLIPDDAALVSVTLAERGTDKTWPASVRALAPMTNLETRQTVMFIEHTAKNGETAPRLGSVVTVSIKGKSVDGLLRVPESAVTQDGSIWIVTKDGMLEEHAVETVFVRNGHSFVRSPALSDTLLVAKQPLGSFVRGRRVAPNIQQDEDAL